MPCSSELLVSKLPLQPNLTIINEYQRFLLKSWDHSKIIFRWVPGFRNMIENCIADELKLKISDILQGIGIRISYRIASVKLGITRPFNFVGCRKVKAIPLDCWTYIHKKRTHSHNKIYSGVKLTSLTARLLSELGY